MGPKLVCHNYRMIYKKIKNNLLPSILTTILFSWIGCSTAPKMIQQREVSSAKSDQAVEIIDCKGSLNGSDKSHKEEDELKYKKIQIDNFGKLSELKEQLQQIQQNEDELVAQYSLKKDYFKSVKAAIQFIDELAAAEKASAVFMSNSRFSDLVNVLNALRNRSESSKEESLEILTSPFKLIEHMKKPDVSIPADAGQLPVQAVQPLDMKMYEQEIVRQSVFGADPNAVCEYAGPKTGYGFKAGLKIQCGDAKLKLKFGPESNSGSFNSRIFRAAGFLTPRIDFVSKVEMKYDRKFILEFNSRKLTHTKISFLGKEIKKKDWNNGYKDPMGYLSAIKLKDGTVLTGDDLAQFKKTLVTVKDNTPIVDESVDSKIDTVTFTEGSVIENIDAIEAGPWRFDEANHMRNDMLRKQLVLSMWVGNNDLPMNNNRLLISKEHLADKTKILKVLPIYIDVGVGLGVTDKVTGFSSFDIEKMSDSMSSQGQGKVTFQFISKTPVKMFDKLTFADVVDGLNIMCKFSSEQIKAALLQSGISEKLSDMATTKLVHRRSKLIDDLELKKQFATCL